MKKLLIAICIFMLFGCQSQDQITMMVPYGSPQFSQLYMQDSSGYDVDIVIGAEPLLAAFGSKTHDVIFAPINLGARLFQSKEDYTLLSVVTWGNYYLVSSVKLDSKTDLMNQTITVFGENQVSDLMMKIINDDLELNMSYNYVDSVSSALSYAILNPTHIVMLAEPALAQLLSTNQSLNFIDCQSLYEEVSGDQDMPQAGVFVRSTLDDSIKNKIASDLEASILTLHQNYEQSAILAKSLGMDMDLDILSTAIQNSHIIYRDALASRDSINVFFGLIIELNPALIGGMLPSDHFYEDLT